MKITLDPLHNKFKIEPPLADLVQATDHAVITVSALEGNVIVKEPSNAPALGPPQPAATTVHGYRVVSRA